MRVRAVLEVKVDAFFFAQTLDKRMLRFVVLHAINALRVGRAELEVVIIGQDAVLFEHLGDDLAHGHLLENPLIDPVRQVRQMWAQRKVITRQAPAGFATGDAVHLPVNAGAQRGNLQKRLLVQQLFEVKEGPLTDQLQFKSERHVQGLAALEGQYLKVRSLKGQREMGLISR